MCGCVCGCGLWLCPPICRHPLSDTQTQTHTDTQTHRHTDTHTHTHTLACAHSPPLCINLPSTHLVLCPALLVLYAQQRMSVSTLETVTGCHSAGVAVLGLCASVICSRCRRNRWQQRRHHQPMLLLLCTDCLCMAGFELQRPVPAPPLQVTMGRVKQQCLMGGRMPAHMLHMLLLLLLRLLCISGVTSLLLMPA